MTSPPKHREPSLGLSLLPCLLLLAGLSVNVAVFRDAASSGPNQISLLLSALFAGVVGRVFLGRPYRELEARGIQSIGLALEAVLILLLVGCIIGLWILSGAVPTMIHYGVMLINPQVFLPAVCLVCSVVSVAVGSSWSTMGTVGIALIGVGRALGFSDAMVAGAVISGAYFGDKVSPLSDTTNLAPAAGGSTLFEHIRHVLNTTVPAYAVTLALFLAVSLSRGAAGGDAVPAAGALEGLSTAFNLHWGLLLAPALVVGLAAARVPAVPSLAAGGLLGAILALQFQPQHFSGDGWAERYATLLNVAHEGFILESGNPSLDELLSRGGMSRMYSTVSLIITAMLFGGVMEGAGMLQRIARAILSGVRGAGSLIGATICSCALFNVFASEQYLAIVVPGRMFRSAYREMGLAPKNLSRALEDGGTMTSVLVPWNTCGAFAAAALSVPTLQYLPWCFLNLLSPVFGIGMAMAGIAIARIAPEPGEPDAGTGAGASGG